MLRLPRFTAILALAGLSATFTAKARAQLADPSSAVPSERAVSATSWAFGARWEGELIPVGIAAGLLGGSLLLHQQRSHWGPDAAHPAVAKWDNGSYATVGGAVALGMAHYVLRAELFHSAGFSASRSYQYALPLLLEDMEAVVVASGVTNVLKKRAGRCRPRAWRNGACDSTDDEEYKAFPSAHTTIPSALAGVHLVEAWRAPNSVSNWFFFGGLEFAALSTAILRVKAGAHSWSDVAVGYAIGQAAGVLTALAHPRAELRSSPEGVGFANPAFGFDGKLVTVGAAF